MRISKEDEKRREEKDGVEGCGGGGTARRKGREKAGE